MEGVDDPGKKKKKFFSTETKGKTIDEPRGVPDQRWTELIPTHPVHLLRVTKNGVRDVGRNSGLRSPHGKCLFRSYSEPVWVTSEIRGFDPSIHVPLPTHWSLPHGSPPTPGIRTPVNRERTHPRGLEENRFHHFPLRSPGPPSPSPVPRGSSVSVLTRTILERWEDGPSFDVNPSQERPESDRRAGRRRHWVGRRGRHT